MQTIRVFLASLAMAIAASAGAAATLLDTLDPTTASYFNLIGTSTTNQDPLGQSFTLADRTADLAVAAQFINFSNQDVRVTASLVEGAGTGGTVLGSQDLFAPAADILGRTPVLLTADFSVLGLVPGGTYTIVYSGQGALSGGAAGVITNGTQSWNSDGLFDFRSNLAREFGVTVTGTLTPIPLPAGGLLLLAGLGVFGAMARRRKA